jgi:outer membrane receptor protein involved in Fe transport
MQYRMTMCLVVLALAISGTAAAQMGSELTGRVSYENAPMPGVTVTLTSPALQGQKVATTNAQGDYIFKVLPAGDYRVRFGLDKFATLEFDVRMSTSQPRTLDAVMYPEAIEEEIVVTSSFETVSTGAQGSSTMELTTMEKLAVGRDMDSAVLLSAGTTNTGAGGITISGAASWESLFTVNGVVVNENNWGQPYDLYIEDAIVETTTMTSNMSAEYGRFGGGVVNTVTKSGGNQFSGSFRVNVSNDSWNGETPLTVAQVDENNYVYEATFGGFIVRDALWFFAAGRDRSDKGSDQLITPGQPEAGIPYPTSSDETRLEGKLTGSIGPNHRIMLSYIDVESTSTNNSYFAPAPDVYSLADDESTHYGVSATYTGVLSDNFFLEALYSKRDRATVGGGTRDYLGGSPIWDYHTSLTFNDSWFDGLSTPDHYGNENYYAKASWFLSGGGTHDLVFGVDYFDDTVKANNRQTASTYSFWNYGPPVNWDTPGQPLVTIAPYGGYIIWYNIEQESLGNHVETSSLYVNDTWRVNDRLTVNLGARYDKHDAADAAGLKTADDSRVSPRLSASYDVKGDGSIILNAGFNRYVTALTQNQSTDGSAAGDYTYIYYTYAGPEIIAGTDEYPSNEAALEAMFDWFFNVYGGPTNLDMAYILKFPGLTPKVGEDMSAPYADEFTLGVSFRLGTRGVLRADYVHRKFGNFYSAENTPGDWAEIPGFDAFIDVSTYTNDDSVHKRKYDAIMGRFDYRIGTRWNIGANYTWSKAEGTFEAEHSWMGPVPGSIFEYREYKEASWFMPNGLLAIDQTHKFRGWVVWDAIATSRHNLSLSLLQNFFSGTPYGAVAQVNTIPYVGSPSDLGYAGSVKPQQYYFTDRDAFRTENVSRTDIALNYSFFINIGGGQLELFLQPEVINVFNEHAVEDPNTIALAARNDSNLETFNPFTETPVEGVHWRKSDAWGTAESEDAYQTPRTFRFSLGLRF